MKPENLLYKSKLDDSPIKLCDFGFAKQDNGDLSTPQFTPYYVAPQVLEAQKRHKKERSSLVSQPYTYDKSCDMWSLGVIIYILMCGYPPFYSEHPSSKRAIDRSMRRKIMNGTYQLDDREWERVSPQAKDVVQKLLCVDQRQRLDIDGLVNHSWLTEEAPDTLLQSPLYISNKSHMKQTAALHRSHIKQMRIIERSANLKPIQSAIIPMLVNRQKLLKKSEGITSTPDKSFLIASQAYFKPLRDIIAFCLFSNKQETKKLEDLVAVAADKNYESEQLNSVLKEYKWNGKSFDENVDIQAFSYSIKHVIDTLKSQ